MFNELCFPYFALSTDYANVSYESLVQIIAHATLPITKHVSTSTTYIFAHVVNVSTVDQFLFSHDIS